MSAVPKPSFTVNLVTPQGIEAVWPYIEAGVARSLETANGEATVSDTKEALLAGRTALLLLEENGATLGVIVRIVPMSRYKVCRVLLAFGEGMSRMPQALAVAEGWAKERGCRYVEAWCSTESRSRLFGRFGYKQAYSIVRKPT